MNTTEAIIRFARALTSADILISTTGLLLFAAWLVKTSFGKYALVGSTPRRNNMPLYMPFIPLFICFGLAPLAILVTRRAFAELEQWRLVFLDNLILCISASAALTAIIFLARAAFTRRLKGFGLNIRTIHRDLPAALLNLLTILPLVTAAIILTESLGELLYGPDFRIQQHTELEMLSEYQQLPLRIIIVVTTVAIAPVFEEMLFRGMFQSMLRSRLQRPWPAVIAGSALFAIVHQQPAHWPALFTLSMCMGYAYEKSGSLLRPILIHALFNGIVILAALNQ